MPGNEIINNAFRTRRMTVFAREEKEILKTQLTHRALEPTMAMGFSRKYSFSPYKSDEFSVFPFL